MPIYEYICLGCGHEFEKIKKITDNILPKCKICGSTTKKQISHTTFHLKGTGWEKEPQGPPEIPDMEPGGIITKTPIIKDRITGKTLSGPDIPQGE